MTTWTGAPTMPTDPCRHLAPATGACAAGRTAPQDCAGCAAYDPRPEIELDDAERTRCEVWTRVMGYHRPVAAFNAGKQAEHRERVAFREGAARAD